MYASVTSNFVLCGLQLFVAFNSRSLSLFAAMTDTFMDLASDAVLVFATVTASKENLLRYPTGKQRFQTAAVVVFSCIMGAFSVELMIEAGKSIVSGSTSTAVTTNLTIVNMSCLAVLIVVKSVLYLYCCTIEKSPTATVLAQHHRNDIILNIAGITLSIFGNQVVWWIDPVGGILIALWILVTWGQTAFEYVQKFVGESAPQAFLNKITYLSINHHNVILKVNAVRAYSSGAGYFVEVEIVMDPNTRLDLAQEIASTLKHKIEAVDDVERAFVHFPSATV
ncbi:cation efflux protein [Obelidium mucronatum]|nr:cation efflux protein [Obelidium mucronatum]